MLPFHKFRLFQVSVSNVMITNPASHDCKSHDHLQSSANCVWMNDHAIHNWQAIHGAYRCLYLVPNVSLFVLLIVFLATRKAENGNCKQVYHQEYHGKNTKEADNCSAEKQIVKCLLCTHIHDRHLSFGLVRQRTSSHHRSCNRKRVESSYDATTPSDR